VFRWLTISLLIVLLLLQYRLWFGEAGRGQIAALSGQISYQTDENERLIERNRQLEAEVEDLKTGVSALEERARSELGMIREGETFYQLIEPAKEEK